MEQSPLLLSLLLLHSFLFGAFLGILNDVSRIVRVFFGVRYGGTSFRSLYARDLPIIHRPLSTRERGKIGDGALSVLIFFQDLFLFVFAAVGCVLLHYEYNSGRFRFFSLPAMVIGFLLYYFTVGKLIMALSERIVFVIKAIILIVGSILMRPILAFCRFFNKKLTKTAKKFRKVIANRTKKLYNKNKKKEWLHSAAKGFVSFDGTATEDQ